MTTYNYTDNQIARAKAEYESFLNIRTISYYDVETIGTYEAERRAEHHNRIVTAIKAGDKVQEREWKTFFMNEVVKADRKFEESKAKLAANKEASADILAPIKAAKKVGDFGKWLNTAGNPYRKEHFSKKYTQESVNAFLNTL